MARSATSGRTFGASPAASSGACRADVSANRSSCTGTIFALLPITPPSGGGTGRARNFDPLNPPPGIEIVGGVPGFPVGA
ncbi:hypothetical protein RDV64_22900 (plasmid) [Acuticoccus sp. MNP-M23]|uniref:hypothetical protein n=1 Tax=Acuticoccus sp. MNP-M23 TaxID=3072793 RepID=UPI0028166E66|nr:hypothetical protein [Acuticoccus sp. MNP-M23]WMS45175.1 hypothetical protein RDV64_22900 [Acuticoccus sp. MNP-M23]